MAEILWKADLVTCTGPAANRKIWLKLTQKMFKTEAIWNRTDAYKRQTFPTAFPTASAAHGRIRFQCVNFLSGFLNELPNSNLTRKFLQQHLALIALSAGRGQNYLTPERDIKIPDKGDTKASFPSIIKIPHKTRRVLYPTTESYVVPLGFSHVWVAPATDEKNSFCFPTSLPHTSFIHRENIRDYYNSINWENKNN